MKKKPYDERDWHERRIAEARQRQAESQQRNADGKDKLAPIAAAESRQTLPKPIPKPGEAGLANEARPGLGTRANNPDPSLSPKSGSEKNGSDQEPAATPRGYEEPRPEARDRLQRFERIARCVLIAAAAKH